MADGTTPPQGGFTTAEAVRLLLRLPTIDVEATNAVIVDASTAIRGELHQLIDQVEGDAITLVGQDRPVLALPERPVAAVASVTVDSVALVEDVDYWWTPAGVLTRLTGGRRGACWPYPQRVAVVYDHGYATVPAPIATVCKQITGRACIAGGVGGLKSRTVADASWTFANFLAEDGSLPLTTFERTLLDPYYRDRR